MVKFVKLPAHSQLQSFIQKGDFCDCAFASVTKAQMTAPQASNIALSQLPSWVTNLMALRNRIVSIFGLKTEQMPEDIDAEVDASNTNSLFQTHYLTEDEIIVGSNDKHLDFRISVLRDSGGYYVSTWVHTHNIFGKMYLLFVMPFHKIIVKNSASRIQKHVKTL